MSKLGQKEAIYIAISSFLKENNRSFDDGEKLELSSEDRKTIVTMLVAAIEAGNVEFSVKSVNNYSTPEKIRNYSTGLLSNWLRKDSRLNGGEKHSIKNPGSRVGSTDNILKSLKALKKELTNKKDHAAIDKEIQKRINELQARKFEKLSIDIDNLPVHLLHLIKQ